ncbi:UNVERIFIED_CONTAM: Golgin candidate 5 [Sesamum indicum]
MAWFSGKVSLGNFPDFAGAVNKLSESVKNIEKNFDSALGLEEKSDATGSSSEASGLWPSATDRKALFEPIMGFMGQKGEEGTVESSEKPNSSKPTSPVKEEPVKNDSSANHASEEISYEEEASGKVEKEDAETRSTEEIQDSSGEPEDKAAAHSETELVSPSIPLEVSEQKPMQVAQTESVNNLQEERSEEALPTLLESIQPELTSHMGQVEVSASMPRKDDATGLPESIHEQKEHEVEVKEAFQAQAPDASSDGQDESVESFIPDSSHKTGDAEDKSRENLPTLHTNDIEASEAASDLVAHQDSTIAESVQLKQHSDDDSDAKEQRLSAMTNSSDVTDSVAELERVKKEMKMLETALQGAARQAQAKADEIAKLMNENEQLKAVIDDLRVYALTKERDTLRREQSKKSDAAALLKEKDEIISQVMAEVHGSATSPGYLSRHHDMGEELSKKQAVQESQIRKLRAQAEESKVESIKRDKTETEKLLQETVEKHQAELATQKEYYTNALNAAKEAEALAEARANTEARTELESRLREAEDRESMLVQTLEELRQTLSRREQQISCLRAEQTQLTKSLEKERQRAAENRQEYLALKEEADTQEGHVNQLEEEIRELKRKHKEELHEARTHQELLQQLEELRADIVDLKEMYREQVNLLVNKNLKRILGGSGHCMD